VLTMINILDILSCYDTYATLNLSDAYAVVTMPAHPFMHIPIHYRHMVETFSDLLSDCHIWYMPWCAFFDSMTSFQILGR
jgi:hypothetical protein